MRVYYQETTGPENYRRLADLNTDPPAPDTLTGATLVASQYDYPLVTVEIGQVANWIVTLSRNFMHKGVLHTCSTHCIFNK